MRRWVLLAALVGAVACRHGERAGPAAAAPGPTVMPPPPAPTVPRCSTGERRACECPAVLGPGTQECRLDAEGWRWSACLAANGTRCPVSGDGLAARVLGDCAEPHAAESAEAFQRRCLPR